MTFENAKSGPNFTDIAPEIFKILDV